MTEPAEIWYDDEAGPVVRPFAAPRRPAPDPGRLDMAELLVAASPQPDLELDEIERAAVERCAEPVTVVEIGAHLGLTLGDAQDLLGPLVDAGALVRRGSPDPAAVLSLLDGLRGL